MTESTGRLLVGKPMLGDPNFERSVILVLEHNADGALGLVLNRPTDVLVADALPGWEVIAHDSPVLHIGGPVEEESGWCLARIEDPGLVPGFVPVIDNLGLLNFDLEPADVTGSIRTARFYAGYSGWGPGQLDDELALDDWFVLEAEPDDPFCPDGATLWTRILGRQGNDIARLAHFPIDPSLN